MLTLNLVKDFRSDHIFYLRLPLLHFHLGQVDRPSPEVPQEPDSHGNQADHGVHAHYVSTHCAFLGRGSPWLRKTL